MEIEFIEIKYKEEISLSEELKKELKKYKSVGVYTTIQFLDKISLIKKQISEIGLRIINSKPKRTSRENQILGCDVYPGNLNLKEYPGVFLYIGTGEFHPRVLLLSQEKDKKTPIIKYNPLSKKYSILNEKDIEKFIQKQRAGFSRFLMSENIGVLITTKVGQSHFNYIGELEKKYKDKNFYYFVCDNIDFNEFENFSYIQSWVNTACPRIGLEDLEKTKKPIVNISELI
jgi:2-(3-amino-3-carboxypropyl)histidine synthase